MNRKLSLYILALAVCFSLAGCTTGPTRIASQPKPYEIVGPSSGSAWGFSLFWCVPIFTLSRFDNAFQEAIKSKQGHGLIDTEIADTAYWTPLGSIFITDVKGLVIRYNTGLSRPAAQPPRQLAPASPSKK